MSIVKNLEIKVNNGEAKLSENVYIYQNDRGIELKLKLNLVNNNSRSAIRSSLFDTDNIFAAATILKPNGELIGRGKTIIKDNTIIFRIDKDFTDNVDEIGIYKIQFHIYDTLDNRITIPPISFEVKELLGFIDEEDWNHNYGVVDNTLSDYCMVADDGRELEIFSDGKYIKTIWSNGDLITSAKLNKIEEAIGCLDSRFYIGGEPLHTDPLIWVDVPDLDNSNLIIDNAINEIVSKSTYLKEQVDIFNATNLNEIEFVEDDKLDFIESKKSPNTNKEKCTSDNISSHIEILLETLNNIVNKVKVLEEEIEMLKNNN